jgi:hypothetical protein
MIDVRRWVRNIAGSIRSRLGHRPCRSMHRERYVCAEFAECVYRSDRRNWTNRPGTGESATRRLGSVVAVQAFTQVEPFSVKDGGLAKLPL